MKLLPAIDPDLPALVRWIEQLPGVQAAWLFGSRARGDHRETSDVDVAVLHGPDAPDAWTRLGWIPEAARALGVPVEAVDLVFLREVTPLLSHAVIRDGRLIVDRDPRARVAFEERNLHRYLEARRLREEAMRERARRHGVDLS